ncbi:MAG: hypothetical protein JWN94_2885 [Betaproteobacteria bacterium]|nr:hypothetical protein [Betaproteobacteria bacterium]
MQALKSFYLAGAILLATSVSATAAAPTAGDSWGYRVVNRYNNEVRGNVEYRVDKVDADRFAVAVSSDVVALGLPRIDVYTSDGRWLKHPLINHDQPVIYEFAQPYPAYEFPLTPGKSWSLRVKAVNAASGRSASVRVDGEVLGSEQVTTPAGAFDTVKIKRRIYAGDFDGTRSETNITETEWYAPALGRAVRLERTSGYMDQAQCSDEMSACRPVRGDWDLFELVVNKP